MAVATVQEAQNSNASSVTLLSGATAGNMLVLLGNLVANSFGGKINSISGVASTWTKAIGLGQAGASFSARLEFWIGTGLVAGQTVITISQDAMAGSTFEVAELSGAPTTIIQTVTDVGTGTTTNTGSLTPGATSGRLVIAAIAETSSSGYSGGVTDAPAAFTDLSDASNGSVTRLLRPGYREPTSLVAHSRTQSFLNMDSWVGGIVELGGAPPPPASAPASRPRHRRIATLVRAVR